MSEPNVVPSFVPTIMKLIGQDRLKMPQTGVRRNGWVIAIHPLCTISAGFVLSLFVYRCADWSHCWFYKITKAFSHLSKHSHHCHCVPLKCVVFQWLPACCPHSHFNEVLGETGSAAHQRQHLSEPGPSPVFFQSQQIHRECQLHWPHSRGPSNYTKLCFLTSTLLLSPKKWLPLSP